MSERKKNGEGASQAVLGPFETAEAPLIERIHGRYETATLYADEIVVLSQIRPGQNAAHRELEESIRTVGLINQIDTVNVSEAELEEYIEFTNSLWGSTNHLDDFLGCRRLDGTYYLLSSGHSRLRSIKSLEKKGPHGGGLPRYPMDVKVHADKSIEAFLQRQIDENIHTNPPIERRAKAIAEYYFWGVKQSRWSTQKEFLENNGNMSKTVVSEALAFANLPQEVREFVMRKEMGFAAAIALGRVAPVFEDYIYHKANIVKGSASEKQRKAIEERLKSRLHIEANHLALKRLNSTASEKRLRSIKEVLLAEMATPISDGPEDEVALIDIEELGVYTPEELLEQMKAQDKAEMARIIATYGKTPGSWAKQMIDINSQFVDREIIEQALQDFEESSKEAIRVLGRSAVEDVATLL